MESWLNWSYDKSELPSSGHVRLLDTQPTHLFQESKCARWTQIVSYLSSVLKDCYLSYLKHKRLIGNNTPPVAISHHSEKVRWCRDGSCRCIPDDIMVVSQRFQWVTSNGNSGFWFKPNLTFRCNLQGMMGFCSVSLFSVLRFFVLFWFVLLCFQSGFSGPLFRLLILHATCPCSSTCWGPNTPVQDKIKFFYGCQFLDHRKKQNVACDRQGKACF